MPKIGPTGQPSVYGQQGIVKSADGTLYEVDPSRNLDGTVVAGFESDERPDLEDAPRNPDELVESPDLTHNDHVAAEQARRDENAANAPVYDADAFGENTTHKEPEPEKPDDTPDVQTTTKTTTKTTKK